MKKLNVTIRLEMSVPDDWELSDTSEGITLKGEGKTAKAAAVGQLLAEKAKAAGITKVVFDRAGYQYHGRVKAVAEGAREGGLEF